METLSATSLQLVCPVKVKGSYRPEKITIFNIPVYIRRINCRYVLKQHCLQPLLIVKIKVFCDISTGKIERKRTLS